MSEEKVATSDEDTEALDQVEDTETAATEALPGGYEELQAQLEAAKTKAEENWDQLLRTKAEMDNLRRRAERDVENAHKYALEKFLSDLLPVKDSLELGLSAVGETDHEQLDKLREGTELTLKMLTDVLAKFNVQEVNPLDETFNPELHQAMSMQESTEKAPNTVLMVMQKGYTLNERLIRPAMVVVSKPSSSEPGENIDEQA